MSQILKTEQNTPKKTINSQLIIINATNDEFVISLDSSGNHLHQRGYIKYRGEAPLRENIAQAMIQSSKIEGDLWDPMCGSGTLLIEYLHYLKLNHLKDYRSFSYQDWNSYDSSYENKILMNSQFDACYQNIYGSDINTEMISICEKNINISNNLDETKLFVHDFYKGQIPKEIQNKVNIISNPPYGLRLKHKKNALIYFDEIKKHPLIDKVFLLIPKNFIQKHHKIIFETRNGGIKVVFVELES